MREVIKRLDIEVIVAMDKEAALEYYEGTPDGHIEVELD